MTLDESIELWQKEHEHEIVHACNMYVEVHEIVDRVNPWHTGTPTEKGLYVVLTKISMDGVSSSEGTYIFDYWDGCSFQYLKRKALVFSLIEPDIYSWVKWQKIEEKEGMKRAIELIGYAPVILKADR